VEDFHGQERELAAAVNHIREGLSDALMESTKNERMKADLITNVSHDIKTPLTSIVNYVDLLKRENLDNENARSYIRILDEKSQRLKQLTEDLVEASKISSGNIKLDIQQIDLVELIYQTGGEFNERFEARGLTIVTKLPSRSVMVQADGRQLYRAIENLYTNAAKYALENTRVYVNLTVEAGLATFSIRNISKNPLPPDTGGERDLTARFVRGDVSRSTEGSGLGLSIAKNLTTLMGGEFQIKVDGDLFVAEITFVT
jgi:signal transduction histidine kinase